MNLKKDRVGRPFEKKSDGLTYSDDCKENNTKIQIK